MSRDLFKRIVNLTSETYLAYDEDGELKEYPPAENVRRLSQQVMLSNTDGFTMFIIDQKWYDRAKANGRHTWDLAYASKEGMSNDGREVYTFRTASERSLNRRVIPTTSSRLYAT